MNQYLKNLKAQSVGSDQTAPMHSHEYLITFKFVSDVETVFTLNIRTPYLLTILDLKL